MGQSERSRQMRAGLAGPDVAVLIADDPLSSVCLGAGKMLDDFDLLRRVAVD